MVDANSRAGTGVVGTPAASVGTHCFAWHDTGQSLLEAKLKTTAEARWSVEMETFIFRDSPIGRRFRDELTAAARRGVRVRLLVDAVGSFGLRRDYFDGLVAAGGAMRWFNDLRLPSLSFRDHYGQRPGAYAAADKSPPGKRGRG